jgi:hypothetical protein
MTGVGANQVITTHDPRLTALGLWKRFCSTFQANSMAMQAMASGKHLIKYIRFYLSSMK